MLGLITWIQLQLIIKETGVRTGAEYGELSGQGKVLQEPGVDPGPVNIIAKIRGGRGPLAWLLARWCWRSYPSW